MTLPSASCSLLVVIVNDRTSSLTIDCLESLRTDPTRRSGWRVVVTDNASDDGSVERLTDYVRQQQLGDWVRIEALPRNGGFAYGNNAAIRPALDSDSPPNFVLLLNPDTVVRPGAVEQLLSFMVAHPQVGIAGSRLEDPDGTPQRSAFRFPTVAGELDTYLRFGPVSRLLQRYVVSPPVPTAETPTDWVAGASMMVRREVFEAIGLLDERYFMYFEEVDFCFRARRSDWSCWYVPQSRIVHLVGQASGVTDTRIKAKRRPDYWFDSRRRFFLLHRGAWYSMGCDLAMIAGLTLWNLRCWIERRSTDNPPKMLLDSCRHSVFLRGFGL